MTRLLLLIFILFCSSRVIADYPLEIIQLQSRPTAEIIPRLNGEQVTIEISPQMNRPGSRQGIYEIQHAQTMVSGKLGEWIAIGGFNQQVRQTNHGLLREAQTNNCDNHSMELLVEEITQ